jgi:IS30 family transposase
MSRLLAVTNSAFKNALEGFSAALNRMPLAVRKSMTYDQGREMAKHAEITQDTGVAIYFCDPHSPWQRGNNVNINGLIRKFLPKGTALSVHSQEQLDEIAYLMNISLRKRFNWKCPIEIMTEMVGMHHAAPALIQ